MNPLRAIFRKLRANRRRLLTIFVVLSLVEALGLLIALKAFADGTITSSCVFSGGLYSCVKNWRTAPGYSEADRLHGLDTRAQAEAIERDRKWQARCRPVIRKDEFGVSRYFYAKPGCEYGKSED